MKVLISLLFLSVLVSCAGKNDQKTKTQIVLGFSGGATQSGGVMIYAHEPNLNIKFAVPLANQAAGDNINLTIPKGTWDFKAVAWDGDGSAYTMEGGASCGTSIAVPIQTATVTVPLTLNHAGCSANASFMPNASAPYFSGTTFSPLQIIRSCKDFLAVDPDGPGGTAASGTNTCPSEKAGRTFSYKIELIGFNVAQQPVPGLQTRCYTGSSSNNNTSISASIPFGAPGSGIATIVRAYTDNNCTSTEVIDYFFPDGISQQLFGGSSILSYESVSTNALFLAYNEIGAGWSPFFTGSSTTGGEMPQVKCQNSTAANDLCVKDIFSSLSPMDFNIGALVGDTSLVLKGYNFGSITGCAVGTDVIIPTAGAFSGNLFVSTTSGGDQSEITACTCSDNSTSTDPYDDYCTLTIGSMVTTTGGSLSKVYAVNVPVDGEPNYFRVFVETTQGETQDQISYRGAMSDVLGLDGGRHNRAVFGDGGGDDDWLEYGAIYDISRELGPDGVGGVLWLNGYSSCQQIRTELANNGPFEHAMTIEGEYGEETIIVKVKNSVKTRADYMHGTGNFDLRLETWFDEGTTPEIETVMEFDCEDTVFTNASSVNGIAQGYSWTTYSYGDSSGGETSAIAYVTDARGTTTYTDSFIESISEQSWTEGGNTGEGQHFAFYKIVQGNPTYIYGFFASSGIHFFSGNNEISAEKYMIKFNASNQEVSAYVLRGRDVEPIGTPPTFPEAGNCNAQDSGRDVGNTARCTNAGEANGAWTAWSGSDISIWTGDGATLTTTPNKNCSNLATMATVAAGYCQSSTITPASLSGASVLNGSDLYFGTYGGPTNNYDNFYPGYVGEKTENSTCTGAGSDNSKLICEVHALE